MADAAVADVSVRATGRIDFLVDYARGLLLAYRVIRTLDHVVIRRSTSEDIVASLDKAQTDWLEVIGKALGFLCVQELSRSDPTRVGGVLQKVNFLESLGIPQNDAAVMVGSTANSVRVLRSQKGKGGMRGKTRKK